MRRTILIIVLVLCLAVPGLSGCFLFGDDGSTDTGTQDGTPAGGQQGDSGKDDEALARITVPNVVNLDVQVAIDRLLDEGLKPMLRWSRAGTARRLVLSQSSDSGEFLAPGSFVELEVSLGPAATVPPPPFIAAFRLEQEIAARAAANAGGGETADGGSTSPDGGGTTPEPTPDPTPDPTPPPAPEDDPNDIPGVVGTSPASGNLSVTDPDDVYRVIMDAGDTIVISVTEGANVSNSDFQLMIFDPSANSISDAPAASTLTGDYPRNLTYTATTGGTFYILVHHAGLATDSGGDYVLSWSSS